MDKYQGVLALIGETYVVAQTLTQQVMDLRGVVEQLSAENEELKNRLKEGNAQALETVREADKNAKR